MTEKEFLTKRSPFLLDNDSLRVIKPQAKYANEPSSKWLTEMGYPYLHTIRGFEYKDENTHFVHIFWNDYEIPNVSVCIFTYLFSYFPGIQYIGVGCKIGKPGEIWEPRYKVYKNE